MTAAEALPVIRSFIEGSFFVPDPSTLADDASLLDQGLVDSTGVLEIVAFLEERFGVAVADEELLPENLDSVARLAAFVARRTAGG